MVGFGGAEMKITFWPAASTQPGGEKRHMVEEDEQARAPARQQRTVFARGTRHQGNRQQRILKTRFIDVFLLFTPLAHPDLQY